MPAFTAPTSLAIAFSALTFVVVSANLYLLRRAAPAGRQNRWLALAIPVCIVWVGGHAALAESGVLALEMMPPPPLLYLVTTMALGVALVFSPVGRRLSALPLWLLVGLQTFRVPLEALLHALYDAGSIPIQMTWSGYNFDVLTGITALLLAVALKTGRRSPRWVWAWNILGLGLLVTVVGIALLSLPLPLRQFTNDPPVLLPFHAPFNWIVNVHVWTALVGHLLIFRALRRQGENHAGS